jgi:hypothetical protein
MRAAEQWALIEAGLEDGWDEVLLSFAPEGSVDDAATALGPLQPGRVGNELRLQVTRTGGGPERLQNLLRHLDRRRIWGALSLVSVESGTEPPTAEPASEPRISLVSAWDATAAELPPDWSDLLCELELDSSDHLPRAALLGAPLNPTRNRDAVALRFRVSGKRGYGASPLMVRRCLERMDAEGITGTIRVLYELSDTENAVTQGPVWRVAGRSV